MIAFSGDRAELGNLDVYVMNAGSRLRALHHDHDHDRRERVPGHHNAVLDSGPKWSPDCANISYHSLDAGGSLDVHRIDADGTGDVNLTNTAGVFDAFSAWSPDGTQIAFSSNRDGNFEIYTMDATDGANVTRLTYTGAGEADVRPDWGSRLRVAPTCTQTLTGDNVGPFTVNVGQMLCVVNARVAGPITVNAGGSLSVIGSQITNGIVATSPVSFSLCGSQVSGPSSIPGRGVVVTNSRFPLVIGDPAAGCAPNRVAGDITLTNNTGGLTVGGNLVSGNVTVNNNTGSAVIKANTVLKTLACSGNSPAPVNAEQPNTATVSRANARHCDAASGTMRRSSEQESQANEAGANGNLTPRGAAGVSRASGGA